MGCDIHLFAERCVDGVWRSADTWTWAEDEGRLEVAYEDEFYGFRNYRLFAILAGVRNYYELVPLSEPRGLPADVSTLVAAEADYWSVDGHSHSWLTLAELLDAGPWDSVEGDFATRTIPRLLALGEPEDVRIVFWFDN